MTPQNTFIFRHQKSFNIFGIIGKGNSQRAALTRRRFTPEISVLFFAAQAIGTINKVDSPLSKGLQSVIQRRI